MPNRRDFVKGLISAGVVLGSASLNPFSIAFNHSLGRTEKEPDLGVPKIRTEYVKISGEEMHARPKVRVVGLGGSGGKAIDYMIRSGLSEVDFIMADRDIQSLNSSQIPRSILLETDLSRIGAGADEGLLSTYDKDKEKILQALEGSFMVFIIAGLGGGTGTFWAPVIAEICSKLAIVTIAVITMPLCNGPSQPRRWAEKGIEKLSTIADTVIPINLNEYDFRFYPESDLRGVYNLGHKTIFEAVKGITEIFLLPGFIGIDPYDVEAIFYKKGLAAFQIGVAEGRDSGRKATQMAIEGLSGRGVTLASLQSVLLNFNIGLKLNLGGFDEISKASRLVMREMDNRADIIWNVLPVETMGEKFKTIIFAVGGKYEKPQWAKNIFYQVENKNLNSELERLASEMDCTAWQGEPFTPDLIATPYFVSIVDRNLIGEKYWNLFLRFCKETRDDTPLIIVDQLRHLELPDHKNILFVDLDNPHAFEEIKSYIRKIGI